jgi:outer membrane protein assembly factor BamB
MRPTSFWIALLASTAGAQDWPQWRGPNRDGTAASFRAPTAWPERLSEKGKVEVGSGYATPLFVDDRLYLFTRQGEEEVLSALDALSGELLWRASYPAPFEMNPATKRHGPGPKSTPALAEGRVFTLGMSGIVSAFDAESGRELWRKPAPPVEPLFHTATSPLVDDGLVVLHVGGHNDGALTAFDAATGAVRWSWNGDGPAYGSPVLFELAGVRQIVTFTQENFIGVAASTGELLWRRSFVTPSTTTSQTPLLYEETIIQAGRANGITAFRVLRRGDGFVTEDVWHTDLVSLHMTNGVVLEGVLYGLSHLNGGQYFGLELASGKVLWTSEPRQAENAAMISAGDTVLSLEDDAELVVIRGSRTAFEPLKRYPVAASATWAQPALSGNRLFVKDVSTVTLFLVE